MKTYLVVTYTKRYECVWQIIDETGKVLKSYRDRQEALEEMNNE